MTKIIQILLSEFIATLPPEYRAMFTYIAEYAISLGYTPKRTRTKHLSLDFSKSKVGKTIMKMEVHDNGKADNPPGLRLKFYANKDYSDIFHAGIKTVIEEFGGRYTGCYGCGRCKPTPEGYTYIYADGRRVFRCGNELIAIHDFTEGHVPEILRLIKVQDDFFVRKMDRGRV